MLTVTPSEKPLNLSSTTDFTDFVFRFAGMIGKEFIRPLPTAALRNLGGWSRIDNGNGSQDRKSYARIFDIQRNLFVVSYQITLRPSFASREQNARRNCSSLTDLSTSPSPSQKKTRQITFAIPSTRRPTRKF